MEYRDLILKSVYDTNREKFKILNSVYDTWFYVSIFIPRIMQKTQTLVRVRVYSMKGHLGPILINCVGPTLISDFSSLVSKRNLQGLIRACVFGTTLIP